MATANRHTTLSELLSSVKEALVSSFSLPRWVTAEIGEMHVNRSSGHCYLELIEKGGANGVPSARVNASIWRNTYSLLSAYFRSATGQELCVGMKVLLKVTISFHELYGFSLQISDIDPAYTLGEQELQRQQTITQLKEDGIYDLNKKLPLPIVLQRIAVISSATAAGYRDFMKELESSPFAIQTTLFQAFMQGDNADQSIIAALEAIAEREEEFDAVAIIRGGGSQSDLSCFNSYELCCNIAQFPLPILTGIGHDKDESVADMVVATALKTPTAVAQHVIHSFEEFYALLVQYSQDIKYHTSKIVGEQKEQLLLNGIKLERAGNKIISENRNKLILLQNQLKERTTHFINSARQTLDTAEKIIYNSAPERILARGFAIVKHNGKAVRDAASLTRTDTVEIRFEKGTTTAQILDHEKADEL